MYLRPAEDDDAVGLKRKPIHMGDSTVVSRANLASIHGGAHGRRHKIVGNPEPAKDLGLSVRCGSAVTAHGRNDEGFSATFPHEILNPRQQLTKAADASAACSDRDTVSRLHSSLQPGFHQLG